VSGGLNLLQRATKFQNLPIFPLPYSLFDKTNKLCIDWRDSLPVASTNTEFLMVSDHWTRSSKVEEQDWQW
jgi:hypothetical protein